MGGDVLRVNLVSESARGEGSLTGSRKLGNQHMSEKARENPNVEGNQGDSMDFMGRDFSEKLMQYKQES